MVQDSQQWPWLFRGIRPVNCAGTVRDGMGQARIATRTVVTGLRPCCCCRRWRSRCSAARVNWRAANPPTAAIPAARLSQMAPVASEHSDSILLVLLGTLQRGLRAELWDPAAIRPLMIRIDMIENLVHSLSLVSPFTPTCSGARDFRVI